MRCEICDGRFEGKIRKSQNTYRISVRFLWPLHHALPPRVIPHFLSEPFWSGKPFCFSLGIFFARLPINNLPACITRCPVKRITWNVTAFPQMFSVLKGLRVPFLPSWRNKAGWLITPRISTSVISVSYIFSALLTLKIQSFSLIFNF